MQAALDEVIAHTDDFREEQPRPEYSPACVEIGVLSGLSFKLCTRPDRRYVQLVPGFSPRWRRDLRFNEKLK